ncbi:MULTISPECIES: flavodoxin domain-containing protein [unclassified Clostridium]|uniref:flavodoxin domain-containing protein n=1 Tax=unclassified Clostridium TaxID=2614128 RepID=UPI00029732B5|nr:MULTISPECIES: flavodoxin domain-containing protein [unclassified Clostridium]EKQ57823.1 MAG: flavodoxin [Clostridium sp. Maddingley MBC34-26]
MKILILFASKYGGTEKCANLLSEKLQGDVKIINLKATKNIPISDYDKVIIGTSIYAGNVRSEVKKFCSDNLNSLMSKPFSLFLCCSTDKKSEINSYVEKAFPSELIKHATVIDSFGSVFNFSKMNFFERQIIKMIGKSKNKTGESDIKLDGKTNVSTISNEKILEFANIINR